MMRFFLLLLLVKSTVSFPQRAAVPEAEFGVEFERNDANGLPLLKLPYGTWRAYQYDSENDIYTFKNIRFAAPPLGSLRFAAPAPPVPDTSTIHDGSYGPVCRQSTPSGGFNVLGSANEHPLGATLNQILGHAPAAFVPKGDEDCLFLDLYVPGTAIRKQKDGLKVVVYIYGGAYIMGSKDSADYFYNGSSVVQSSGGNLIFVVGNYRLGAFGWLAGWTMETDGLPNAGLHDQRAVFEWVQTYIDLLGGNPDEVTAWGLSAGGGSIFHHLVAKGGTHNPLFKRAILQSPAFATRWDRGGSLENTFNRFAAFANCADEGLSCLRAASSDVLDRANRLLQLGAPRGAFAVGPSADGQYIRQLAALEYASGNYWTDIDSLLISHTSDEAEIFVLGDINTDEKFTNFLNKIFPEYAHRAGIVTAIEQKYPALSSPNSNYTSQIARLKDVLRDSSINYNSRALTEAYKGKTYNMQYSASFGWHAVDLLPTFYVLNHFKGILRSRLIPSLGSFSLAYQSYLTSFAMSGNPNERRLYLSIPRTIHWPKPNKLNSQFIGNVLNVGDLGFSIIDDEESPRDRFDFWTEIAAALTNVGGYAVPGGASEQRIIAFNGDSSKNFEIGVSLAEPDLSSLAVAN